jgi:hypothetical protein
MKQKKTGKFGDEICRRMAAVQSVLKKIGSSNQKSGSRYLFSASLKTLSIINWGNSKAPGQEILFFNLFLFAEVSFAILR